MSSSVGELVKVSAACPELLAADIRRAVARWRIVAGDLQPCGSSAP